MDIDKASEILNPVIHCAIKNTIGVPGYGNPAFPLDRTLEELCIAARTIGEHNAKGESGEIFVTVDDRMIAALYALAHYDNDPETLLEALGYSLRRHYVP